MQAHAPRRRGHSRRINTIEKERDFWGGSGRGEGREREKKNIHLLKMCKIFVFE